MGWRNIVVTITTSNGDTRGYLYEPTDYGQQREAIEWAIWKFRQSEAADVAEIREHGDAPDYEPVEAQISSIVVAEVMEHRERPVRKKGDDGD